MQKYFTVILMYVTDHREVLNNVEKVETTDTEKLIITHWIYVGDKWFRTKELVNPKNVTIMTGFDLHELER